MRVDIRYLHRTAVDTLNNQTLINDFDVFKILTKSFELSKNGWYYLNPQKTILLKKKRQKAHSNAKGNNKY